MSAEFVLARRLANMPGLLQTTNLVRLTQTCRYPAAMQRSGPLIAVLAGAVTLLAGSILTLAVVIARRPDSTPATPPGPTPDSPQATAQVFDGDAMDRDIAGQYQQKFGDNVQVDCPARQPVTTGTTFICRIVGGQQRILVTVTSDRGDYTWKVEAA